MSIIYKFRPSVITDNFSYNMNLKNVNVCKKLKLTIKNLKSLNIFYVNAQGFNKGKQDITFDSLINIYDIIFIAESWYLDFYEIIKNPCFVATTPLPIRRNNIRPGNGIFCFANSLIKSLIKVMHVTDYSITIKVCNKVLMAVYYPPSLKRHIFEKCLTNPYSPDIIFGDFNVDIFDCKDEKKKKLTLYIYLQKNLLERVCPVLKDKYSKIPKWDHVFAKKSINLKLYVGLAPFSSDHQSFEMKINLNEAIRIEENSISNASFIKKKYNLKNLNDPLIRSSLVQWIDTIADNIKGIYDIIEENFKESEVQIKQEMVDMSDELLIHILQDCCEEVLGTFKTNKKVYETSSYKNTLGVSTIENSQEGLNSLDRRKVFEIQDRISEDLDSNTTIRLFKEHMKSSSNVPQYIESSKASLSAIEDAFDYYSNAYKCIDDENPRFNPKIIRSNYLGICYHDFYKYINYEIIINKINNLSSNKACGSDGIHAQILKALLNSKLPKILESLFKMCVKFGVSPLRWNSSIIFPIPKKNDSSLIKDFRPIAITNIFRKLFEGILLDFINGYLKNFFKLCDNQAGFRRGFSTLTHALISNETAKTSPKQYHVFLDLKKAYDSVPVKLVLEKLEDRQVPMGIISLIASLFSECTTRVLVNQEFTNEIKLERGLLQGSILSPLLFNIFIDDLASKLTQTFENEEEKKKYPLPHCLFYADDIKINHSSASAIQEMLNICSEWADNNGMEFNIDKSSYLIDPQVENNKENEGTSDSSYIYDYNHDFDNFNNNDDNHKDNRDLNKNNNINFNQENFNQMNKFNKSNNNYKSNNNLINNNNNIEKNEKVHFYITIKGIKKELSGVVTYKYLGFPHTVKGIDWKEHLEDSSKKSLKFIKSLYYYKNSLPTVSKLIIFKTFIRPIMEYSACLSFYWMDLEQFKKPNSTLNYEEVSGYHKVMTEAVEWIVGSSKFNVACSLLGLPPTMLRLYILALRFKIHLDGMSDNNPLKKTFDLKKNALLSMTSFAGRIISRKDIFNLKYFNLPPPRPKVDPITKEIIRPKELDDMDYRINLMIKNYFLNLKSDAIILPYARTNKIINPENSIIISPDRCIFIRDSTTRYNSINWRLNSFGHKKTCPICGESFNRGHINECKFIEYEPFKSIITENDLLLLKEDKEKFKDLPKTYNILDS